MHSSKATRGIIPTLNLPDMNDRHVLAAAIHGGAQVIVTKNLKDFPAKSLQKFKIKAQHPDKFILNLIAQASSVVLQAAEEHRKSLKKPPKTLVSLESQDLPESAAALRRLYAAIND
jgi:hypothetical protein